MGAQAEQNQAADLLVSKCTNPKCGHTFLSRNPIFIGGGSTNITVRGTRVPCERCGAWATQLDWDIDSQGRFQLREIFDEIRNYGNVVRLKEFQEHVTEAANDEITANELADALGEVDPRFAKFKTYIKSLPKKELAIFINALFLLLTLVFTIASYYEQAEANELTKEANATQRESLSIQQQQLELDQLKFKTEQAKREADQKVDELEDKLELLLKSLEEIPYSVPTQQLAPPSKPKQPAQPQCNLRGNQRNKPCFCGSGLKAKKCHPFGIQSA